MAWLRRAMNENQQGERHAGEKREREVSQEIEKEEKRETLVVRVFKSLQGSALISKWEIREERGSFL